MLRVRVRGASHPQPAKMPRGLLALRTLRKADRAPWRGPTKRYDILKEGRAIPFTPGLRHTPRWIPVHRLIGRDWSQQAATGPEPGTQPKPGPKPEPTPTGQQ